MRTTISIVLALLLAGCRHHHLWSRDDASAETLKFETYQCERDASFANRGRYGTSMDVDHAMFDRCMEAHGWVDGLELAADAGLSK